MAFPVAVELSCPLCTHAFTAREMGQSFYISGIDTDLREIGSVEEVRRFSVTSCPSCDYADFTWDFAVPEGLDGSARARLKEALAISSKEPKDLVPEELRPFLAARRSFEKRGMDQGALAELALLTYYVARDLNLDAQGACRGEAARLFGEALKAEEGPSSLSIRYAYLAGELHRLGQRRLEAIAFFDRAIEDGRKLERSGIEVDLVGMAHRQRAEVIYSQDSSHALVAVCKFEDKEARSEVARILAARRDPVSLALIPKVYQALEDSEHVVMLREFALRPDPALKPLLLDALQSKGAENIRLAARALGGLGDPAAFDALGRALERGVLTTEAALVDAIRHLNHAESIARLGDILKRWEQRAEPLRWAPSNDLMPIKQFLYASGTPEGFALLRRDMEALTENDFWDKPPFGSPIPAFVGLGTRARPLLGELLRSPNPVTRRWSAHAVYELEDNALRDAVRPLIDDVDPVVRMQAAKTLARLGLQDFESVVLTQLKATDTENIPFALHFLVEFSSPTTRTFLLDLLDRDVATLGEILPLLGRQPSDARVDSLIEDALRSEDEDTRAGAVTALSFQARKGSEKRLEDLFAAEHSEAVRRRSIFAIARIGESRGRKAIVAYLHTVLASCEPRLRFPVALALLHLGDPAGIDIVRERAAALDESFDHYEFVAPAVKALARYERQAQSPARSTSA